MKHSIRQFVPTDRPLKVVDLGSATAPESFAQGLTHRALFADHDAEVIGLDIVDGPNVDKVLKKPYRLPLRTNSIDVVVSGQVFEHIPFFWASMLEVARVLKPGGVLIMTVPSRGHKHMLVDCWRYYDDGMRALAAYSGLKLRRADTDFCRPRPGGRRFWDVPADRTDPHYWGDTVGVFEKPEGYPTRRMGVVRAPVVWWANRTDKTFSEYVAAGQARAQRRRARRVSAADAAVAPAPVPDSPAAEASGTF